MKLLESEFVEKVRAYVQGQAAWDDVHSYVIDRVVRRDEIDNPVIDELFGIFHADSRDDPQFRESREQIEELLNATKL